MPFTFFRVIETLISPYITFLTLALSYCPYSTSCISWLLRTTLGSIFMSGYFVSCIFSSQGSKNAIDVIEVAHACRRCLGRVTIRGCRTFQARQKAWIMDRLTRSVLSPIVHELAPRELTYLWISCYRFHLENWDNAFIVEVITNCHTSGVLSLIAVECRWLMLNILQPQWVNTTVQWPSYMGYDGGHTYFSVMMKSLSIV